MSSFLLPGFEPGRQQHARGARARRLGDRASSIHPARGRSAADSTTAVSAEEQCSAPSGGQRAGLTAAHAFSATKSTPGRERGDGGGVSGRRKTKVATDDDVDLGAAASLLSSASASRSSVRAGGSAAESPDLWA